jgi:hypothetical protein
VSYLLKISAGRSNGNISLRGSITLNSLRGSVGVLRYQLMNYSMTRNGYMTEIRYGLRYSCQYCIRVHISVYSISLYDVLLEILLYIIVLYYIILLVIIILITKHIFKQLFTY